MEPRQQLKLPGNIMRLPAVLRRRQMPKRRREMERGQKDRMALRMLKATTRRSRTNDRIRTMMTRVFRSLGTLNSYSILTIISKIIDQTSHDLVSQSILFGNPYVGIPKQSLPFSCINISMLRYILVVFVISLTLAAPLNPKNVVIAVNCGSQQPLTGPEGFKYVPDASLVQGDFREADYSNNPAFQDLDIKFTFEKELYMQERHTYSQMTFNLPYKEGLNTLILKFAEMYFTQKGKRVFDVYLGNTAILKNFDVVAEVGRFAAADKYIEIEIKEGKVYFNGSVVKGAIEKGRLRLKFARGDADNPIIQGIIVYNSPLAESNFQEYTTIKNKWAQQKEMNIAKKQEQEIRDLIAIQKKKEKIVIRNDQLEMVDEEEEAAPVAIASSQGRLRWLLMNPLGILIWAVVISCGLVFVYNNVFLMGVEAKP